MVWNDRIEEPTVTGADDFGRDGSGRPPFEDGFPPGAGPYDDSAPTTEFSRLVFDDEAEFPGPRNGSAGPGGPGGPGGPNGPGGPVGARMRDGRDPRGAFGGPEQSGRPGSGGPGGLGGSGGPGGMPGGPGGQGGPGGPQGPESANRPTRPIRPRPAGAPGGPVVPPGSAFRDQPPAGGRGPAEGGRAPGEPGRAQRPMMPQMQPPPARGPQPGPRNQGPDGRGAFGVPQQRDANADSGPTPRRSPGARGAEALRQAQQFDVFRRDPVVPQQASPADGNDFDEAADRTPLPRDERDPREQRDQRDQRDPREQRGQVDISVFDAAPEPPERPGFDLRAPLRGPASYDQPTDIIPAIIDEPGQDSFGQNSFGQDSFGRHPGGQNTDGHGFGAEEAQGFGAPQGFAAPQPEEQAFGEQGFPGANNAGFGAPQGFPPAGGPGFGTDNADTGFGAQGFGHESAEAGFGAPQGFPPAGAPGFGADNPDAGFGAHGFGHEGAEAGFGAQQGFPHANAPGFGADNADAGFGAQGFGQEGAEPGFGAPQGFPPVGGPQGFGSEREDAVGFDGQQRFGEPGFGAPQNFPPAGGFGADEAVFDNQQGFPPAGEPSFNSRQHFQGEAQGFQGEAQGFPPAAPAPQPFGAENAEPVFPTAQDAHSAGIDPQATFGGPQAFAPQAGNDPSFGARPVEETPFGAAESAPSAPAGPATPAAPIFGAPEGGMPSFGDRPLTPNTSPDYGLGAGNNAGNNPGAAEPQAEPPLAAHLDPPRFEPAPPVFDDPAEGVEFGGAGEKPGPVFATPTVAITPAEAVGEYDDYDGEDELDEDADGDAEPEMLVPWANAGSENADAGELENQAGADDLYDTDGEPYDDVPRVPPYDDAELAAVTGSSTSGATCATTSCPT